MDGWKIELRKLWRREDNQRNERIKNQESVGWRRWMIIKQIWRWKNKNNGLDSSLTKHRVFFLLMKFLFLSFKQNQLIDWLIDWHIFHSIKLMLIGKMFFARKTTKTFFRREREKKQSIFQFTKSKIKIKWQWRRWFFLISSMLLNHQQKICKKKKNPHSKNKG